MSRASIFANAAIIVIVLGAAMLLAYQQRFYWELLAMQADGATHVGSGFLPPSIEASIGAASFGAFPLNIPAILRLATLLAGVALIVTTHRQLTAMKNLLEHSTSKSKGHAGA